MGRVTQFIDFINRDKMPDEDEQAVIYTHFGISDKLKKIRKDYRKKLKIRRNNGQSNRNGKQS